MPDLAFTISMLSKSSSTPTTEHLLAATYTLRYLRHTAKLAIQYNASDSDATMPAGYTDSDFAGVSHLPAPEAPGAPALTHRSPRLPRTALAFPHLSQRGSPIPPGCTLVGEVLDREPVFPPPAFLSLCGSMCEGPAHVGHFVCRARIMYNLLSIFIALLAYSVMVVGFVGSIASSVCVRSGRLALNLLM